MILLNFVYVRGQVEAS